MTRAERLAAIEDFLSRMFRVGDIIEIRGLNAPGGVIAALCDDFSKAAKAALKMEEDGATGVYYTLNPVARNSQRVKQCPRLNAYLTGAAAYSTTKADHILTRNIFLVDIDPHRESGTCATDAEKDHARELALEVCTYLEAYGFPPPTICDSGNGYQLLYRVSRLNYEEQPWFKQALRRVAASCNSEYADVDLSVHNLARIARLPWTMNRKGEDSPERPHRMAQVLTYSEGRVKYAQMQELGKAGGHRTFADRTLTITGEDVLEYIERYSDHLSLGRVRTSGDRTYYELVDCPFAGGRHRKNRVGYGKTTLVLGPLFLGFSCFSSDCCDYTFADLDKMLCERTGNPRWQVYEDDIDVEAMEALWGGVEDMDHVPNLGDEMRPLRNIPVWSWTPEDQARIQHWTEDDIDAFYRGWTEEQAAAWAADTTPPKRKRTFEEMREFLGGT